MTDSGIWPLVSIITPSYNQGKFIEATIKSVVEQGYPNLEYIIIDGGSTDETVEIIKKYAAQYSYIRWVSEKDNGQSHAINKGLRRAKGDIVAWLNSDDTYHENALFEAAKFLKENKNVMLVYGDANVINKTGDFVSRFAYTEPFDLWRLIYVSDYIMQPTAFWRREIFESIGYLDESLFWTMDWDFWIRVGKVHQITYHPVLLANNREYGETKTASGGKKRLAEIHRLMLRHGGKKYPPGYIIYALDTYSNQVCRWSKFVGTALRALIIDRIIFRLMKNKSVFLDGTAAPDTEFHFVGNSYKQLTVVLRALDLPLVTTSNHASIYLNGKYLSCTMLEMGQTKELIFPLTPIDLKEINTLQVKAKKYFVPAKIIKGSTDSRRLAFFLSCTVS